MRQTESDKILGKLNCIEKKIERGGLTSLKLVLFSLGFGFLFSSITVITQSPKTLALVSFVLGVILVISATFWQPKLKKEKTFSELVLEFKNKMETDPKFRQWFFQLVRNKS